MWTATYREIDTGGTQKEIRVTVDYVNEGTSYSKVYEILPEKLNSDEFRGIIKEQIDTLESKVLKVDKNSFLDRDVLTLVAEVLIDNGN